jgi:hypothetical protein
MLKDFDEEKLLRLVRFSREIGVLPLPTMQAMQALLIGKELNTVINMEAISIEAAIRNGAPLGAIIRGCMVFGFLAAHEERRIADGAPSLLVDPVFKQAGQVN